MSLNDVPVGKNPPKEVNVIIEIPKGGEPIKYEIDKDSDAIFVDRILSTSMRYPCNYGYVPHTLSEDGDPVDVLVPTPFPLMGGSVIRCRPVGVLNMTDESGTDAKLIAVPVSKLTPIYKDVNEAKDLSELLLNQIEHFFEHYKDLEPGKWVKIEGWADAEAAKKEILNSVARYEESDDKPAF